MALHKVCLLVSRAQSVYGDRAGVATRGSNRDTHISIVPPARRVGGLRPGYRGCLGCERRNQGSTHRGAFQGRARAALDNCAAKCRICLRKQCDQAKHFDQFGRNRAIIHGSGGVDSEGDEIALITIDRGGCYIGKVVVASMRAVRIQKALFASLASACTNLVESARRSRDGEGASVVKHSLSCGDHTWDHKSSYVQQMKTKNLSLDSFHYAASSGYYHSSSSSIFSAYVRRDGEDFRASKLRVLTIAKAIEWRRTLMHAQIIG